MRLLCFLTDEGTGFCVALEHHQYELYLAVKDIDHTRTKARSLQINRICARFHRAILEEFYQVAFRKKIYHHIEELQTDLDQWLWQCNHERIHSGKYCLGRTPYQTF